MVLKLLGQQQRILWYRKAAAWKGVALQGATLRYREERQLDGSRDKTRQHRVEIGESVKKEAEVLIPAQSLPKGLLPQVGDVLLFGHGPLQLERLTQPKEEGWSFAIVTEVEDNRQGPLPHVLIRGS